MGADCAPLHSGPGKQHWYLCVVEIILQAKGWELEKLMTSQVMVWGRSHGSVQLLLGEQWSCSGSGCMYLQDSTFWAPVNDKAGDRGDQPE